uniref:G-protein coupled receptors family 1 profile domain-containing protein n=1 Tax=Oreochromis aureus TaxID=47969 RepID=A0A668RCL1_OREAU
ISVTVKIQLQCPLMTENSSHNVSSHPVGSHSLNVFTITLHGIFATIGIVENLLIVAVVGFHVRRSIISIWILNLAVSDLLATSCLGFLLAAISLDRCLVVLKPVWAQNHRNIRLVKKICGVIWVMALIFTIPFFLFRDVIPLKDGRNLCYYDYARFLPEPKNQTNNKPIIKQRKEGLAIMKLFFAFLIPLVIIIVSYAVVHSIIANRCNRRPFRFVRLVVSVVVSFVLCWAPYHIFIVMEVMAPNSRSVQDFIIQALPVAATIGFLNSVLNPVLYVFSCPDLCNKIRHSRGAVMESVLAEDLVEFARRRSTARTSIGNSEMRKKHSLATQEESMST